MLPLVPSYIFLRPASLHCAKFGEVLVGKNDGQSEAGRLTADPARDQRCSCICKACSTCAPTVMVDPPTEIHRVALKSSSPFGRMPNYHVALPKRVVLDAPCQDCGLIRVLGGYSYAVPQYLRLKSWSIWYI